MKSAIVLMDGVAQVMLWGETPGEKAALGLFEPSKQFEIVVKHGSFIDDRSVGYTVGFSSAGYLRTWEDSEDAVMLVITPKPEVKIEGPV